MTQPTQAITIRRRINAKRDLVFSAFSHASALEQWFSPHPEIAVNVTHFEFREGGRYRFQYLMPNGDTPALGGQFKLIRPPGELVFTWVWEAPDPHAHIPTIVSITLQSEANATEIALTHSQIPSSDFADRHAKGWEETFDNLEMTLAAHPQLGQP